MSTIMTSMSHVNCAIQCVDSRIHREFDNMTSNFQFYRTADSLHEHRSEEHEDLYCAECRRVFRSEHNLGQHRTKSNAHNTLAYRCVYPSCNEEFMSWANVVLHLESGSCPSNSNRAKLWRILWRSKYGRKVIASEASAAFRESEYGTEDIIRGRNSYRCPGCSKESRTMNSIVAHLNSPEHEPKVYVCHSDYNGCDAKFSTLSGLFQHQVGGCNELKTYDDFDGDYVNVLEAVMSEIWEAI